MAKHRVLSPDAFVDKFQGNEALLQNFAKLWGNGLNVKASSLDVPGFKRFIEQGDGSSKDEFLEELHRVYDLCTDRGHEDLVAACRDFPDYDPDPDGTLPVELLCLKVRTENEDAFNLAYDPVVNVLDEKLLGSHAKFCVADGSAAYVGSANLTGPALSSQLEMGILIRGPLARQVEEFWNLCLQMGIFVEALDTTGS